MAQVCRVEGLSCGGCSSSVISAIQGLAPGAVVQVELDGGLVTVEGVEDESLIRQAVEDAGFTFAGVV
ncbi:MAG: heavy-metal-associated domain-containing protein [gamma proteobacterium symbiont of Phacoides pectinatus]